MERICIVGLEEPEYNEIQRVLDGMARLQGLIVHLLDTARLERGMFDLEIQDCDLAALARETSMILSPTTTC